MHHRCVSQQRPGSGAGFWAHRRSRHTSRQRQTNTTASHSLRPGDLLRSLAWRATLELGQDWGMVPGTAPRIASCCDLSPEQAGLTAQMPVQHRSHCRPSSTAAQSTSGSCIFSSSRPQQARARARSWVVSTSNAHPCPLSTPVDTSRTTCADGRHDWTTDGTLQPGLGSDTGASSCAPSPARPPPSQ